MAIGGNQWQSVAISGNPCPSEAISGNPCQSVARDERQGGAEQGATLAAHLSGGIETQYASPAPLYGANDAVILVPWAARP